MTEESWRSLLPLLRPGSRTVLCDSPDNTPAIELARRGFRLLLLHDGGFDVAGLRQSLRDSGLSSQLMGAQAYPSAKGMEPDGPGGRATGLAPDFYELWISWATPLESARLTDATFCLKPGAPLYWPTATGAVVARDLASSWETISHLPEGIRGLRRRGTA